MEIIITPTEEEMSKLAAQMIQRQLLRKPSSVLGLATGSTMEPVYAQLVAIHRDGKLSLRAVQTFNLDEYVGLPVTHPQSYHHFMHENFFKHVNIPPQNIYIPSGTTSNYRAFCEW